MRLIDADKIDFESTWIEEDGKLYFKLTVTDDYISEQPTIDPVMHAKWIEIKSSDFRDNDSFFKCSLCGRTERHKEPYCNCGAKMDGADKNVGSKED